MLLFFYGAETLLLRRAVSQLKQRFLKTDSAGTNLLELDPDSFSLDVFSSGVKAAPFLAKSRFVIVEDVFGLDAATQKALVDFLKKLETKNVVLFTSAAPDKRLGLYKYLKKTAQCKEFAELGGSALLKHIQESANRLEVQLDTSALRVLQASVGNDLLRLENELHKLSCYADDGLISSDVVEQLVATDYFSSIFDALDAMADRRGERALQLLHEQIQQGQHPLYLLSMLTTQFRQLLVLADLQKRGEDVRAEAKKAGIHPFVVQKLQPRLRGFSLGMLRAVYMKLVSLDEAVKTGEVSPLVAVDLFVSTVSR